MFQASKTIYCSVLANQQGLHLDLQIKAHPQLGWNYLLSQNLKLLNWELVQAVWSL